MFREYHLGSMVADRDPVRTGPFLPDPEIVRRIRILPLPYKVVPVPVPIISKKKITKF